jgi:hypothetical protein
MLRGRDPQDQELQGNVCRTAGMTVHTAVMGYEAEAHFLGVV